MGNPRIDSFRSGFFYARTQINIFNLGKENKISIMKTKLNPRVAVLLLLIVGAASTRFFSVAGHSPLINFTPIGAMALFGGGLDITTGLPYTRDIYGLLKCYYPALLFLKNFFLGTAFYCTIMFGVFEFAQRRFPVLSVQQA